MMGCMKRYEKYRSDDLDTILILIRSGAIKSGRYAHLVKIKENKIIKEKELFNDEKRVGRYGCGSENKQGKQSKVPQ